MDLEAKKQILSQVICALLSHKTGQPMLRLDRDDDIIIMVRDTTLARI